ncbi:MAG: type II secretion system protein GspL [Candidatus Binatia bacterium]
MPQRILALEVDAHELKAAVVETTFRDYRVVGFYGEPLASTDALSAQLRDFVKRHEAGADTVLSSLPGHLVALRTFFLPFRDRKRLDQTVPFELETQVPFGVDDMIVDYHVLRRDGEGTMVLAATVLREDLERHLSLLRDAGLDPKVVDLAPLATLNVLQLLGAGVPESFVYIDGNPWRTVVAVFRDRHLLGLRTLTPTVAAADGEIEAAVAGNGHAAPSTAHLRELLREIRWSILAFNAGPLDPGFPCLLAGEGPLFDQLGVALTREMEVSLHRLGESPLRNIPPALRGEVERFATPLGLALREVSPGGALGVNFRQGEFAYHRGQDELRRALWGTGTLAAVLLALIVTNQYMSYEQLAGRLAALQTGIRNVFVQTLPDVRRVADERTQLKAEIDAAQKRLQILGGLAPVSGATAIDVMRTIATAIPDSTKVDTDEYVMDPEAVRIKARADSFEAVDSIKQQLLNTRYFGDVQVKEVKAAQDGKVDFRLVLTLNKDTAPAGAPQGTP